MENEKCRHGQDDISANHSTLIQNNIWNVGINVQIRHLRDFLCEFYHFATFLSLPLLKYKGYCDDPSYHPAYTYANVYNWKEKYADL